MDVHEYLGVLRRGLVFIVLGVLLGLAVGAVAQSIERPSYAATSRDLVTNKTSGDLTEWLQASSFTESRIASYVLVASSGLVLQPVIDELGLDTTVEELAEKITVTAPPQTFIIEITATAATPELARDIANAVSAEFSDVVSNQLETTDGSAGIDSDTATPSPSTTTLPDGTVVPIAEQIAPVRIVNIEEAALSVEPLPSNSGLFLVVGAVLGLAVGLLAASLREGLDRRVRSAKDIATVANIPVVGDIPADPSVLTSPLVARSGPGLPIAEAFRALRAHLDHLRSRDGRHSFVITAAGERHGATTVTANLAVAMANTATSVVVVDADLRSSALSRLFGIHGAFGLTEVLSGRTTLDAVLQTSNGGRLTILPAGGRPSNPGELLATPTMRAILAELRGRFDAVLVDAPTISAVTDAAVLGSFDSSTLLVLAEGTTTRPRLEDALSLLAAGGSTPVGIVLNEIPKRRLFGRAVRPRNVASGPTVPDYVPRYEAPVVAPPAVEASVVEAPPAVVSAPTPEPAPEPKPAPVAPAPEKEPAHLADPVAPPTASARAPRGRGSRRASSPVISTSIPMAETPVAEAPMAEAPAPRPAPPAERAHRRAVLPAPTPVEHSLSSATELDSAFAALPTATAAEQRAGEVTPEIEQSRSAQVERPIVIRPDAPKPSSRFAPDPGRFSAKLRATSAYATAPPPALGTEGIVREPVVNGTVINTVSIRRPGDVRPSTSARPPIRHILPRPTESTNPPRAIDPGADAEPQSANEPAPTAELEVVPVGGSLLGEIGGLPRVEVRSGHHAPVGDSGPNPERQARERYELRARELERAAHERLMREQQRLTVSIREQLAYDKRELESVLDNRLEDTVIRPVVLPPSRADDPRFSDPSDDDGDTR